MLLKSGTITIIVTLLLAAVGCAAQPEAIEVEVTREVPVTQEVPVTVETVRNVEITREVPVTQKVPVTVVVPQTVEVTREVSIPQTVEVTREVPITRIVETTADSGSCAHRRPGGCLHRDTTAHCGTDGVPEPHAGATSNNAFSQLDHG